MPLYVDPLTFGQTCEAWLEQVPGTVPLEQFQQMEQEAKLAQVIEREAEYVVCKLCGSKNVVKDGVRSGIQYYWCKDCRHKFSGTKALPNMRVPPDHVATALNLFYEGLSMSEIGRSVAQVYQVSPPADSTVYEWITRFTRKAVDMLHEYRASTGPTWAADETVLDVAGGRTKAGSENTIWFWDVIDEDTRFLLASHLSRTRTIKDAQVLFNEAVSRSSVIPRYIVTDKLAAYLDGIERVFGADTTHVRSQGLASPTHNNLIERFHGTLKQRTKVMRGLRNPTTAKLVLDGWLIHYNYFRPHEGLRGKTPAQAAGIEIPLRNWKDIVMHPGGRG